MKALNVNEYYWLNLHCIIRYILFLPSDTLMRTDYQLFYPGSLGPLHISTTSGNTSAPSWNPSFYSSLYQATTLHLHHGMQSFT